MTVLEALDTAVVELDRDNRVRLLNSAAEQCLAIRRERLQGKLLDHLESIPQGLREAISQTRADQRTRRLRECRCGGGLYDCTVQLTAGGNILLEFYDLEWNWQRHQLAQREVQTGLLDLLRRNLGHEIRNPLGGIRGAAQMMAEELGENELGTLARLVMREADRIDDLIQRFWQPEPERYGVDLHRTLEEALELSAAEMGEVVEIVRDYDPSIPQALGDASALRRVFLNLVRNAWQANAKMIKVRSRIEHGTALLQSGHGVVFRVDIEDDGEGVPEELRPLLFLPMVTGRRDGTGLGLALAQQIAASHGGLVSYEDLGSGSQFSLRLPVPEQQEQAAHG